MLILIKTIIPSLRMYLHDYIPAKTIKRDPPKKYSLLAISAEKVGCSDLADLCREMALAMKEQGKLVKEDFELCCDRNTTREEIIENIRDYYTWQNYSFVKGLPNGLIYQQHRTYHMINITPVSKNIIFVTVFECCYK